MRIIQNHPGGLVGLEEKITEILWFAPGAYCGARQLHYTKGTPKLGGLFKENRKKVRKKGGCWGLSIGVSSLGLGVVACQVGWLETHSFIIN